MTYESCDNEILLWRRHLVRASESAQECAVVFVSSSAFSVRRLRFILVVLFCVVKVWHSVLGCQLLTIAEGRSVHCEQFISIFVVIIGVHQLGTFSYVIFLLFYGSIF